MQKSTGGQILPESFPRQEVEIWGGMECTINRVADTYFDQLDFSKHWEREGDIGLIASLGLRKVRYPILWEHHQSIAFRPIDWHLTDLRLQELCDHHVEVIAGLVHHGSGPSFVEITTDNFATGLATYASQVAERYPWIQYYTPVNEPLTTARFCGLYGTWYPHERDDASFCRILLNECKGTALAMAAIRIFNPSAKLVQTDDLAKVHSSPLLAYQAAFENERRWLSFDLLCGKVNPEHALWDYLTSNGINEVELNYFINYPCPPDIIGVNYYLTSERYLDEAVAEYPPHTHGGNGRHQYADVEAVRVGKIQVEGLSKLSKAAWNRYSIPIAVTEVHLHCTREEQMRWLEHIYQSAKALNEEGLPVISITAWALFGSFGWDKLLTRESGTYEPGVFDLNAGYPRPTILTAMIKAYASNQSFRHPVLGCPGWWERNCRIAYGADQFYAASLPSGQPLVIKGLHAALVAQICGLRGLPYKIMDKQDADRHDGLAWATITVNDHLRISQPGREDLVLPLHSDTATQSCNMGLDLFLDGETGEWEHCTDGFFPVQIPKLALRFQSLAS